MAENFGEKENHFPNFTLFEFENEWPLHETTEATMLETESTEDKLLKSKQQETTSSRFANLSEEEMQKILESKHSEKTKKTTNLSVSTFKGIL